jgi:hypothetical protein
VSGIGTSSSPSFKLMGTHQHHRVGMLVNIPIWHSWTHDVKWKRRLGCLNNGERGWIGNVRVPVDIMIEGLGCALSTPLRDIQRAADLFDFPQEECIPRPNCLDAHWFPVVISLPDIRESKEHVVWEFITQLYVGEDSRSTEEGVSVESGPQAQRATETFPPTLPPPPRGDSSERFHPLMSGGRPTTCIHGLPRWGPAGGDWSILATNLPLAERGSQDQPRGI